MAESIKVYVVCTMADNSHVTKQEKVDKLYNATSLPDVENLFQKVYFVTLC